MLVLARPFPRFGLFRPAGWAMHGALQWVNSQINFSRIAIMVQPLKDEIVALQLESDKATEEMSVIEEQIDDLQRSIAGYEHTTAVTIAATIFPSAAPTPLSQRHVMQSDFRKSLRVAIACTPPFVPSVRGHHIGVVLRVNHKEYKLSNDLVKWNPSDTALYAAL